MKTVLITGSSGFIGKNLAAHLSTKKEISVLEFNKSHTLQDLEVFVNKSDFIFHVAGVNRPKNEKEFNNINTGLTETIIEIVERSGRKIPILLTSSTQADQDNPYGKSKLEAEKKLMEWSEKSGSSVCIYRLPNVFGKWSKPNYNSVVATFCHNISHGIPVEISDPEKEITFVYIDNVLEEFYELLNSSLDVTKKYYEVERKFTISLGSLAEKIKFNSKISTTLQVPDFANLFDRFLYATYVSFAKESDFSYELETHHDERGWLAEFIKSENFGQIFVSSTEPGYTRGNHWHHTKIEKFLVVVGTEEIKLRNYGSDEVISYKVSPEKPTVVDMPAGYVHSIKNVGKTPMITLFWSDEILNKTKPDTYFEEV